MINVANSRTRFASNEFFRATICVITQTTTVIDDKPKNNQQYNNSIIQQFTIIDNHKAGSDLEPLQELKLKLVFK